MRFRAPHAAFAAMAEPMSLGAAVAWIVVIGGTCAAWVWWLSTRGDGRGLVVGVVSAPLFAFAIARPLVSLFPAYVRWVDERTWSEWQGRHYAFDDRQVRVAEGSGRLWFASRDVHRALDRTPRAHILRGLKAVERTRHPELGDALSVAGLRKLFDRSTDARVLRFLHWAERDVERPWKRKAMVAEGRIAP